MTTPSRFGKWTSLALIASAMLAAVPAWGAVTGTGDVVPANPATWTSVNSARIGITGIGSVTVDAASKLATISIYVGYGTGSAGTATVDGVGSTWTDSEIFYVGYNGSGVLNITNGGSVSVTNSTYIAYGSTASGTVNFGLNGGTLTTRSLYAAPAQITGTGTINARGLVSDVDLFFDANHGMTQSLLLTGVGQNVTLNLDLSGNSGSVGDLGVGKQRTATLTVRDGMSVTSGTGCLGYAAGSMGHAVIDGSASIWTTASLYVGKSGNGTLDITNRGAVASASTYLGNDANTAGTATVDGFGSTWTISQNLNVGYGGSGVLNINGGRVTVTNSTTVAAGYTSSGAINFGPNGGTLTTQSLTAMPSQLTGMGTINTRGLVSDVDLLFDAAHGLNNTVVLSSAGQNILVNVDLSGNSGSVGALGAGFQGTGTLAILDGMKVTAGTGVLGYKPGSTGIVTISGPGSTWNNGLLFIGNSGTGSLTIANGGNVSSGTQVNLGFDASATGTVVVDGTGSTWTVTGMHNIGYSGAGTLSITHGGKVTSGSNPNNSYDSYVGYNAGSMGTVIVDGTGSTWANNSLLFIGYSGTGALNISNGGQVTVATATHVASPRYIYEPIGTGSINFGSNGGTLTTQSLYANPAQLIGTGTIKTRGLVSDVNLVFDAIRGPSQTLTLNGAGQNVMVHLDLTGGSGVVGDLGAGYQKSGTLTIQNGSKVTSAYGYLGYESGSCGTATVTGAGSSWTNNSDLYVGYIGTAILDIGQGGTVSNHSSYIGWTAASMGTVTVNGAGSVFSTQQFFDVGESGNGILRITNGGKVNSGNWANLIGRNSGSSGTVIVDGPGSRWNNADLDVGGGGTGVLNITNGGNVNNTHDDYIGFNASATGTVSVTGTGSSWTCGKVLYIGNSGTGTLNVSNGGTVTGTGVSINNLSLLAMNVGDASSVSTGTGTVTNSGVIRLKAVAGLAVGSYTPITATTWSGTGSVQALGGSWNTTTHAFLVTAAASGVAGQGAAIDRSVQQRVTITDPTAGSVYAGFTSTTSSSSLTFGATPLTDAENAPLLTVLGTGGTVLAGWTFTTTGYTPGDPVFLSLQIGPSHGNDSLAVWHYDGTIWTPFAATDLSYDGQYANFTVTGFSGYAVVAPSPVPEPGAVGFLLAGTLGLLVRRRQTKVAGRLRLPSWCGC